MKEINPLKFLTLSLLFLNLLIIPFSHCQQNNQQQVDFRLIDDIENKIIISNKFQYQKILNETDCSYLEYYYSKSSNNSLIGAYQLRIIDRKLDFLAKIMFIDCDENSLKEFPDCKKFGDGKQDTFPRLKMAVPSQNKFDDKQKMIPYREVHFSKDSVDHNKLFDFITENIQSFSVKLNSENFDYFANATFFNKVILFTEKKTTPNLFKGLSNYYYDRILFAEVEKKENELLIQRFNITKFPTIMVLENSAFLKEPGKIHFYEGMNFPSDIAKFLEKFCLREKHYMVRMEDLKSAGKIDFLDSMKFMDFFNENKLRNKIVYFHNDENGFNDIYNIPESVKELMQFSR